jgi:hypothetical protein
MINYASVAAATAVAGYDILQGTKWRRENYARKLVGVGFNGSAVVGDCDGDLFLNGVKVGEFKNLSLGWGTKDHLLPTSVTVPANALLELKMTTAPTTNAINVLAVFTP